MLKQFDFKKLLPHVIAVITFVILSLAFFSPVLEGKKRAMHDITSFKGMAKEVHETRAYYDEEPLWTNSMFLGMPTFQLGLHPGMNILTKVSIALRLGLPRPADLLFLYMIGFYILLLCLRINPWLSIAGAIAFGLSSYFLIIIGAGHTSKAHAIGYMAPLIGGFILAYRGKIIPAAALIGFFMALEVNANHFQITYYTAMIIAAYVLVELYNYFKEGKLPDFFKRSAVALVAVTLGIAANTTILWTTTEYAADSMRGKPELTIDATGASTEGNATEGLNIDYATRWSLGVEETLTLFAASAKGGPSGPIIAQAEMLKKQDPTFVRGVQNNWNAYRQQKAPFYLNAYYGNQPNTSPVYLGALALFLFIMAIAFLQDRIKWAFLFLTLLAIALAWGKNFLGLSEFFFEYFPGYNKFRAVTMTLVIAEVLVPLLGIMFLHQVIVKPEIITEKKKKFLMVTGGFAVVLLAMALLPDTFFTFLSDREAGYLSQVRTNPASDTTGLASVLLQLKDFRIGEFTGDVLRTLLFGLLGAGLVWFYANKKLNQGILIGAVAILFLVDMWPVDRRMVNNERDQTGNYISWEDADADKYPFAASNADFMIYQAEAQANPIVAEEANVDLQRFETEKRKDVGLIPVTQREKESLMFAALRRNTHYRVLNTTVDIFQEGNTPYFHKSIGGYHAAKMQRYQDLISFYIAPSVNNVTRSAITNNIEGLRQEKIVNMLNTKYIIANDPRQYQENKPYPPIARVNPHALGNAWAVSNVETVKTANDEILKLRDIDPATTAVVSEEFGAMVPTDFGGGNFNIELTDYHPNRLSYNSNSDKAQLVLFSEFYYGKGWNAYIDDKPVDHFRANYVLRALSVPAGQHKIDFRFEPTSYFVGNTISLIAILILFAVLGWVIFQQFKTKETPAVAA